MVNLPEYPRRIALTEEPKSSFGGAQIAGAYGGLAQGLDELGKGIDDVAVRLSEDAGRDAVSIGEDGKPQVRQAPLIGGKAADAYQRTASFNAMTQADAAADRALLDLRDEHKNDPGKFLIAARAFQQQHVENWSSAGPAVRDSLKRAMETRTTGIYAGLQSEFQARGISTASKSIDATIKTKSEDLITLYRRGGGTDDAGDMTPQAQGLWNDIHSLYSEKVSNPLYKTPHSVAFAELDALHTRAAGGEVFNKTQYIYQNPPEGMSGREAALKFLYGAAKDMEGRVKQIDQIVHEGQSWINAQEALYRGDRENLRRDWQAAKPNLALLTDSMWDDYKARAREVHDNRTEQDIDAHRSSLGVVNYVNNTMTPEQKAEVSRTGVIGHASSPYNGVIDAAEQKYGIPAGWLRMFAKIESGFNPNAQTGSYKGMFQLSDSEFAKHGKGDIFKAEDNTEAAANKLSQEIGQFKQQTGRDPQAWEMYLIHQQGAGGFANHTANPSGPAWQNMLATGEGQQKGEKWAKAAIWGNLPDSDKRRFGSVENVTSQDFMNVWQARTGGLTSSTNLLASREGNFALKMLKDDQKKQIPDRLNAIDQQFKNGRIPDTQELIDVGAMIGVIGTPEQRRKAAEYAVMAETGAAFQQLSAPDREAAIAAMDERLKAGGGEAEGKLVDYLRKSDGQIKAAYKDSRWDAFPRFSQHEAAKATPPMNFNDPAQMSAVKDMRLQQDKIIQQQQGIGAGSIFRPSEAANFGAALASADGKQTSALMRFLTDLPPDTLRATIEDPKVKEALTGAARSSDTAKYTAAMIGLDSIQARNQYDFKQAFGPDVEHALADWQSNDRYLDPKALAEERRRRVDPSAAKAMEHVKQQGREAAYKTPVDDIVKKFDQSWLPGFLGGDVPVAPVDDVTRGALLGDYVDIYSRRFASSQDKGQAEAQTVKMLGSQWKRSEVNGGKLMRDAPELLYPEVGGDHGWMGIQVRSDLEQKLGMKRDVPQAGAAMLPLSVGGFRNFDYELVADDKTHAEGSSYDRSQPVSDTNKAPTYKVLVRDNRTTSPKWDFVYADSGMPLRYQFDPTNPRSTEESKFRTGRSRNESFLAAHDTEAARADRAALPTPPPTEFRNRSEAR